MAYAAWFSASAKIKPFSHVHCVKVSFSSERRVCCLLLALSSPHLTHTKYSQYHVNTCEKENCLKLFSLFENDFSLCFIIVQLVSLSGTSWISMHCVSSLSSFLICRNCSERRPNVIVVTSVCGLRFSTHRSQSCRGQKEIDATWAAGSVQTNGCTPCPSLNGVSGWWALQQSVSLSPIKLICPTAYDCAPPAVSFLQKIALAVNYTNLTISSCLSSHCFSAVYAALRPVVPIFSKFTPACLLCGV